VELQSGVNALRGKGFGLAVISYDPPEILAAFSRQRGITFPLLSDAGSATIKAFGILNTVAEEGLGPNRDDPEVTRDVQRYVSGVRANPSMIGMAFPGTFMLDRQGRVTSRFFEEVYIERNTVSSTLMRLGAGQQVAGTKISTEHLEIATYPSDAAVAPGNRFTLALDIKPHRSIHVYSPEASGYRPIAVTIDQQPFIRPLPVRFPPSEIYFFRPLKERVPVYQKPFTLLQEIVVEGTQQAQSTFRGKQALTVTGTLDYQACDESVCFNPVSVPLSWTLTLRPIITERPQR
jgi:hypothetical protein